MSLVEKPAGWCVCIAMVALAACGSSSSEPPSPALAPAPASPAPIPRPAPAPAPTPPPAAPPSACTSDGECNFADPCQPNRCVALPAGAACSQPTTSSGSCVCFEGRCAMRPSSPRTSNQACKDNADCHLDATTAQCEPGIVPDDGFRMRFSGPTCHCGPSDHRCHLRWFDPVPCSSDNDCWLDEQPTLHAIRRPARLKGRKFRGCVDGEQVPVCKAGRCTLEGLTC